MSRLLSITPDRPTDVDSSLLRTPGFCWLSSRPTMESLCWRAPLPTSREVVPLDRLPIRSSMDRLFERIESLVDRDSVEGVCGEGVGVVVLVCGVSVCRGVNRR